MSTNTPADPGDIEGTVWRACVQAGLGWEQRQQVVKAFTAIASQPSAPQMLNGLTEAETNATASVDGLSAQDAMQAEPAVSMDDVHTLIGHAEGLKCDGQTDMPAYFYRLAERLAGMVDGAAAADRVRTLATAPATVRQSRMVEVPDGWQLVPIELPDEMIAASGLRYDWKALQKTMGAWAGTCAWHKDVKEAIAALESALAATEQEPAAVTCERCRETPEGWIVVKEHVWEHGDGERPTLAYLWPSEFDRQVYRSFQEASAFIQKEQALPLGWVAMRIQLPAAAPSVPEQAEQPISDADIREVFLANGFVIKDGLTDLKPYVYTAARALLALAAGRPEQAERPVLNFNEMTASEYVGAELFAFQEATGCDTADQYVAAQAEQPARFVPVGACTCAGPDGPCEGCIANREAYEEWRAEQAQAEQPAVAAVDKSTNLQGQLVDKTPDLQAPAEQPAPQQRGQAAAAMVRHKALEWVKTVDTGSREGPRAEHAEQAFNAAVEVLAGLVAAPSSPLTQAAQDVLAERQRQVEQEGWTPEHDDEHVLGELPQAAGALLLGRHPGGPGDWGLLKKHRTDRRRQLVIGVALGLAEIERWDRAASKEGGAA